MQRPWSTSKQPKLQTGAISGSGGQLAAKKRCAGGSAGRTVVVLKFKVFLRRSRFLQGRTAQWPAPAAQNSTDEQQTGRVVPHALLYLIWPLPAAGHEAITDNLASSQCTTASRQLCCQLLPNTREATDAVTSAERHHTAKHGRECTPFLGVYCALLQSCSATTQQTPDQGPKGLQVLALTRVIASGVRQQRLQRPQVRCLAPLSCC